VHTATHCNTGGGGIDFDNEPPLLEELGIDFEKICKKVQ